MSDTEKQLAEAKALLEGGSSEAARLILLQLLQGEPNHPTALLMLGGAYFYEKKYAEAQLAYERLIELEPASGMLSIALFNTLWKQGKHDEAAAEIARFIKVANPQQERATLEQYADISRAIAAGSFPQQG